jgi:predicted dehydrogenase
MRVALVGAGSHSEEVHGPSLARYVREHPGEVELAAVCDLREERARLFQEAFGFARAYTDLDRMLEEEKPDAVWVIAPLEKTRELAGHMMERHFPVLFEKPPGRNLQEAHELAEISRRTGTPNLVAFNRRQAPCTQKARSWAKEHGPFEYLYARLLRFRRLDARFAYGTGIHLLDCARFLAEATLGKMVAAQTGRTESLSGHYNFHVHLQFRSGGWGRCDLLPTCGRVEESYALYGEDACIVSVLPLVDEGGGVARKADGRAELWVNGELVEAETWPAEPMYLNSGFYHESAAFIAALQAGRRPSPSAEEAVPSVALAEAVQEGRDVSF